MWGIPPSFTTSKFIWLLFLSEKDVRPGSFVQSRWRIAERTERTQEVRESTSTRESFSLSLSALLLANTISLTKRLTCHRSTTFNSVLYSCLLLCVMVVLQIEAEVRAQIERWEAQQQRPFLVQGMRFVDYIREQWDDYHRNKENEKEERVSDVTPHEYILLKATCFLLVF